jgi:DNA polymerase V
VHVFIQTNGFRETDSQYNNAITHTLTTPTSDTRIIIEAAKLCLSRIYRNGYRYKKAGIMLMDLILTSLEQKQLFVDFNHHPGDHLMNLVDRVNKDHGPDTLFFGAQGTTRDWKMRCGLRSPRYTTQWDELLIVS